jgi:hypothetical protein
VHIWPEYKDTVNARFAHIPANEEVESTTTPFTPDFSV